jgi:hypothetical protein
MDKGQWTVDNEERIVFAVFSLFIILYPLSIEYLALL